MNKEYICDVIRVRLGPTYTRVVPLFPTVANPLEYMFEIICINYGTDNALMTLCDYIINRNKENEDRIYSWFFTFLLLHVVVTSDHYVTEFLHIVSTTWINCTFAAQAYHLCLKNLFEKRGATLNMLEKQYYLYCSAILFSRLHTELEKRAKQPNRRAVNVIDMTPVKKGLNSVFCVAKIYKLSCPESDREKEEFLVKSVQNYSTRCVLNHIVPFLNTGIKKYDKAAMEQCIDYDIVDACVKRWCPSVN